MALTEFGKAVRKARIDVGCTLLSMAEELETTSSFLSGLETGRKNISASWVTKIEEFFSSRGLEVENLKEMADVSNQSTSLDGLSFQQQMLVAGFAKSNFTAEELKQFSELLERMRKKEELNVDELSNEGF